MLALLLALFATTTQSTAHQPSLSPHIVANNNRSTENRHQVSFQKDIILPQCPWNFNASVSCGMDPEDRDGFSILHNGRSSTPTPPTSPPPSLT